MYKCIIGKKSTLPFIFPSELFFKWWEIASEKKIIYNIFYHNKELKKSLLWVWLKIVNSDNNAMEIV